MSIAQPDISDRAPGTWTYFGKSTDYGTAEEVVEFMGRVAEEPTLNTDPEEYEYEFSGTRYLVNDVGHMDESIELTIYPSSEYTTLKLADVVDEDGERQFNVESDWRVWVMREAEDTEEPFLDFGAKNVHWYVEEVEFANGPLTMQLTGQVNGGFDWSPPELEGDTEEA